MGKDANSAFVAQMVYNSLSFINGGDLDDSNQSSGDASDLSNNSAYPTAEPEAGYDIPTEIIHEDECVQKLYEMLK